MWSLSFYEVVKNTQERWSQCLHDEEWLSLFKGGWCQLISPLNWYVVVTKSISGLDFEKHSGASRWPWRMTSSQKTDNISSQWKTEIKNNALPRSPFLPLWSTGGSGDGTAQLEAGRLLSLATHATSLHIGQTCYLVAVTKAGQLSPVNTRVTSETTSAVFNCPSGGSHVKKRRK